VLDTTTKPYRQVRQMASRGNSKSPQKHLNDFLDLVESYCNENRGNIKHLLETWNGESVRFYHDLPYWLQAVTKCYGSWQPEIRQTDNENKPKKKTNDIKKADLLIALNKLLNAKEIKIPKKDPNPPLRGNKKGATLVQQLTIYKEDDAKIPTDRVISLALAAWMAVEGENFLNNEVPVIDW